ncbi:MAG: zinc-finger domain-containing protein [Xanthomonadales bacterium]|nr:zinc-finger domain-containing protein [Xanthomonadales bacterium]
MGQTNRSKVEVSHDQLPLSCPMPEQKLWNAHPRVFLPIEDNGEADCPYCGTHYTLKDL